MRKFILITSALPVLLFFFAIFPSTCFAHHNLYGSPFDEILIFILFILIAYASYVSYKIKQKSKKIKLLLNEMAKLDPKWEINRLLSIAKQNFLIIQQAKNNQDLARLKALLYPELYFNFEKNIRLEIRIHFRDIMLDINIHDIQIVNVKRCLFNKKIDCFIAYIKADGKKQTFLDGKIIDIDSSGLKEFWTFAWHNNQWVLYRIDENKTWKNFVAMDSVSEK